MAFRADYLRLERLRTEVRYHSAYNFLSLKGALAERWAHGPVFGAFADLGQQVTLTPASGGAERIEGTYGLKAAAFDFERVRDRQQGRDLTENWLGDVLAVLQPKRTIGIKAMAFGLYPVENPDRASKHLREEFFQPGKLNRLKPERFPTYHSALNGLLLLGDTQTSYVVGAVGPPHRGTFFQHPDPERDDRWWMGVNVTTGKDSPEGIEDPGAAVTELLDQLLSDFDMIASHALRTVV